MSDVLFPGTLPYSVKYFENVSVRYINLRELARGALDSRELHRDGYWKITDSDGTVAYHAIKNGTPYRFIGRDVKGLGDFIKWLEKEVKELFISYYFLEEGTLKYLMRCWTEEPVLRRLQGPEGQISELFEKLLDKGKTGLLRIDVQDEMVLIPVIEGRVEVGWMPGRVLDTTGVEEVLYGEAAKSGVGFFYPGETPSLSGIGLDEISLLLSAFNKWYTTLMDTWSDCFMESVNVFGTLRQECPLLDRMALIPDEGLQQKGSFDDPQRLPEVIATLVTSISERHRNPDQCLEVFRKVNKDQRHALNSVGLSDLMNDE